MQAWRKSDKWYDGAPDSVAPRGGAADVLLHALCAAAVHCYASRVSQA